MKGIPTLRRKRLKRAAVLTGVGALVAGGVLLGASQAHALTVLGTAPGAVTLTPASGPMSTVPTYATTEACPTGFQGSAALFLSDPGTSTPASPNLDQLAATSNSVAAPFSGTFNNPLSLENAVFSDIAGTTSELVVECYSSASGQGSHEFVMDDFITVSADGSSYTTSATPPSGPTATTTTLTASPSPAYAGQNVTLTATVSGGSTAPAGTVTFENGNTVVGSGPVTLANGVGTVTTQFASAGTESLSAVYSPASGTSFEASTGTLSLTVNTPPANSGVIPLAVSVPTTGAFSLTVDTTDTVTLTVSGSSAAGATTPIAVSDTRNTFPGWSVTGQDSSWTGTGTAAGDIFSGNQLGWTPTDTGLAQGVTLGGTVAPASPGLGSAAATLASVVAGLDNGYGTSTLGANLNLAIPAEAAAGPYTSGLTISAVTSNP